MNGHIRVSMKHGVNPSLCVCFWCGGDTNEIALLGRLPNDAEAPRKIVASFDPCDACKEDFALGVVLMEATDRPNVKTDREISPGHFPTGRLLVVKVEAVERWTIQPDELKASILERKKAFIDTEMFEMLLEGNDGENAA